MAADILGDAKGSQNIPFWILNAVLSYEFWRSLFFTLEVGNTLDFIVQNSTSWTVLQKYRE